jgi:hypothetical protein
VERENNDGRNKRKERERDIARGRGSNREEKKTHRYISILYRVVAERE